MGPKYDAIVGGGSIAGLTFATEAAKRGLSVLVVEEHESIGEPEKCDGLVSLMGLRTYGHLPRKEAIQSSVSQGVVHSPGGKALTVGARTLEVVVLDRSEFDRQAADEAEAAGAQVMKGKRATLMESGAHATVKVGSEVLSCRYYIDATGPASSPRTGIIPAAKYEVEADWIREGVVEVFLDAEKYPGFFAWVIPFGPNKAKVGAAGKGISSFHALDVFLSGRKHKLLRRVPAPIYVGGPVRPFVFGHKILVGESAGMAKPTTAGGIVTSIAGAVFAARWLAESIQSKDPALLDNYQRDWDARYGKEMRNMLRLRGVFEKLSNGEIDSLVSALSTPSMVAKLSETDFDFHGTALLGALGVTGLLKMAKVVASAEARSLLLGR